MPSKYNDDLSEIGQQAIEQLTDRNRDREQALAVSREVVRSSANAIRAVHRADFDEARELVQKGAARLKEAEHIRVDNPLIYNAGFMNDARKEFTEANVTLAVISGGPLPRLEDLGVDPSSYLNGMAEVIGELRRYILDRLRSDEVERCQEMMEVMDEIYGVLVTVDFPEAVTGGLRHSTDAMRGVLERTRGDLTMALRQRKLEIRLADWEKGIDQGS
jgi:translin